MSRTYLVLDIETVPDPGIRWDAAVDGFPPAPCHQVVALGVLWLDAQYAYKRLGTFGEEGEGASDEAKMLQEFSDFVVKEQPHFVTFNGRAFDLPVLVNRMLKHGVSFPIYYTQRDYRYRFSDAGHVDLADVLTDYGASRRPRLDSLAQLVGMPGKMEIDGSQVKTMYEQERYQEIRDYCLHDVVQTSFVFLRTELLRGKMTRAVYEKAAAALWETLENDARVSVVLEKADRALATLS